jgi:hypothetical protein
MRLFLPAAFSLFLILPANPAGADASLQFTLYDAKGELDAQPLVLVKQGQALLRERPEKNKRELLYQQANRSFILIDHKHRRLTTVNEQSVVNLVDQAQQMLGMMKGVSEHLALLPPEQRAKVENLLGGIPVAPKSAAKAAPAIQKLTPAGQRSVAGLPCRQYQAIGPGGAKADHPTGLPSGAAKPPEGYRAEPAPDSIRGIVRYELCLASAGAARITAEDDATLRDMQALALELAREAAPVASRLDVNVPTLGNIRLDGLLLALHDLSRDNGFNLTLAELKTAPVDEQLLRVPQDYQPRQLSVW